MAGSALAAMVAKELRSEFRTRVHLISMLIFSMMAVWSLGVAFAGRIAEVQFLLAGALWVVYLFAALVGLPRTFGTEVDRGTFDTLLSSPVGRGTVFLGKFLAVLVFLVIVEAASLVLFAVFFSYDFLPAIGPLAGVILLGTVGLAAVGTLSAAVATFTRAREVTLIALVVPLTVQTILQQAISATATVLSGDGWEAVGNELRFLGAAGVIYLTAGYVLFDYLFRA